MHSSSYLSDHGMNTLFLSGMLKSPIKRTNVAFGPDSWCDSKPPEELFSVFSLLPLQDFMDQGLHQSVQWYIIPVHIILLKKYNELQLSLTFTKPNLLIRSEEEKGMI